MRVFGVRRGLIVLQLTYSLYTLYKYIYIWKQSKQMAEMSVLSPEYSNEKKIKFLDAYKVGFDFEIYFFIQTLKRFFFFNCFIYVSHCSRFIRLMEFSFKVYKKSRYVFQKI